jgi:hypothetical protein
MPTPQQLAELRKFNLQMQLGTRFGGSKADLARAIGKSEAYVWQLLNGRKTSAGKRDVFGEKIARDIEAALNLPNGALDAAGPQGLDNLSPDEAELLKNYRDAHSRWRLTLTLLSRLPSDSQAEVSESVNIILAKVAASPVPNARVEEKYGLPPTRPETRIHDAARPSYRKKTKKAHR